MMHSQAALVVGRLEYVYRAMRPIQRIVHILHHFYGFTARECVATLASNVELLTESNLEALTESNVETLIYRATQELKQAMEMKS